jgi:hypothetical protein
MKCKGLTRLNLEYSGREPIQVGVADIVHRIVRRCQELGRDSQRKEATVRALAPLQVCIDRNELLGEDIRCRRANVGSEGTWRRDCSACELDAESTSAG